MGDETADETAEDEEKVLDVKADAWAKRQRLRIRKHPRSIDAMFPILQHPQRRNWWLCSCLNT